MMQRRLFAAPDDLTPREAEVLRLVAAGKSNREVATALFVAEETVKFHLVNIFRKLDVTNRTAAAAWAHRTGLMAEPPTDHGRPLEESA